MHSSLLHLLAFQSELNRTDSENRFRLRSVDLRVVKILPFHKRKLVNSSLMRIPCGRVSCDFALDFIPVAHENRAMFSRPSFHVLVHPVLRNRRVWE